MCVDVYVCGVISRSSTLMRVVCVICIKCCIDVCVQSVCGKVGVVCAGMVHVCIMLHPGVWLWPRQQALLVSGGAPCPRCSLVGLCSVVLEARSCSPTGVAESELSDCGWG